ncbi:MAG: putative selenium-dependent hydroxylase accessory protein YqeC [Proteobacteria bacterium]|nr:putative selenium-dependent hydroxylase accessory protein YqeC [Pseudomonadota bacterium]
MNLDYRAGEGPEKISLRHALLLENGGVITIMGAGGKTSLMFQLAKVLSLTGDTVLTTTTTKIREPHADQSPCTIVSENVSAIIREATHRIPAQLHITAARARSRSQDIPQGKLIGFMPGDIDRLWHSGLFKWIIVEADGAAGRPLKVPSIHEPVIPVSSNWVIGVVGLSACGNPLTDKWVFRSNLVSTLTGLRPGESITDSAIVTTLCHDRGILKGSPLGAKRLAFLNQADTPERIAAGRRIIARMTDRNQKCRYQRVVLGQLLFDPLVIDFADLHSPE